MFADQIRRVFEYNVWANHLLLEKVEKLSVKQLNAPLHFPHGSLWETLFHIFDAEWIWRKRIQGEPSLPDHEIEDYKDLTALRSAWSLEEKSLATFLAEKDDADLSCEISYTTKAGQFTGRLGDILIHLAMHGMQHRAEVAQMLTGAGQSPGDIDYGIFRGLIVPKK
jgi:uncharacterized damage-inducible protein DinB